MVIVVTLFVGSGKKLILDEVKEFDEKTMKLRRIHFEDILREPENNSAQMLCLDDLLYVPSMEGCFSEKFLNVCGLQHFIVPFIIGICFVYSCTPVSAL